MMHFCSYCNTYFFEDPLNHLSSKAHKASRLKQQKMKLNIENYKKYLERRSIEPSIHRMILSLGKLNLYDYEYKELKSYLSSRKNILRGCEKNAKFRRVKIKAIS